MKRCLLLGAIVGAVLIAVLSLAACGGTTASTTERPVTTAAGSATTAGVATTAAGTIDAAVLYAEDCASCHTDVPGGNLDQVRAIIETGKETMPGFKDKLSAEQIAALAAWVAAGGK